jgi:hypothetical protein
MPKRICLIVESPEHGSPVQPIDKLLEKVSPGDSVRIVWLIDAPVAPLKERLEQLGARTTVVMGEPLIQEAAASFSKDLVGILSQLRRVVGQRDFWMMRISEVSLGTRAWFEVVRAWAVTKQIEQHDSDLCLVAGGASMVKFVRSWPGPQQLLDSSAWCPVSKFFAGLAVPAVNEASAQLRRDRCSRVHFVSE